MKKIIYLFGVLVAGSLFLQAEEINAVYFNPSRLGAFDTLRVTNSLNTAADLEVASIDIDATGGTVSMLAREKMSDHELSHFYFGGKTESAITQVGIQAERGKINMPDTKFTLSGIETRGPGKAAFRGTGSGVTSTIYQLGMSSPASATEIGGEIKTGTFTASSTEIRVAKSLTLGGNTIPAPTCSGLTWVTRKDVNGNNHNVLGCVNSSTPAQKSWKWEESDWGSVGYCDSGMCQYCTGSGISSQPYIEWKCTKSSSGSASTWPSSLSGNCSDKQGDVCYIVYCDGITEWWTQSCVYK